MAKGLEPLPGRKSIVLFSDGLDVMSLGEGSALRDAARRLVDVANRSSVIINTIHATGLRTDQILADSGVSGSAEQVTDQVRSNIVGRQLAQGGLAFLAQGTGGRFMHDTNDLDGAVERILEDQQGYYLIGWTPESDAFAPDKGEPRFNSIDVRVTRPGLTVRTRSGYYGIPKSEGPKLVAPARQLLLSLTSPFTASDVRVGLTPLVFAEGKNAFFVRAMLDIDAHDLRFVGQPDGTRMATVELLAAAFDLDGSMTHWDAQQYTVRVLPDAFERVVSSGLLYTLTVRLKAAGAYQIRAVVRDAATGEMGSAYQFVEVPDLGNGRLAMSSPVVGGGADQTGRAPGLSAAPTLEDMSAVAPDFVHPAVRRFRRGMPLVSSFRIYNAGVDRSTKRPELRTQFRFFLGGKQVFDSAPQPVQVKGPTDGRQVAVARMVRLGTDLAPGHYQLQIVVTDLHPRKKGAATAEQWTDFTLE